MVGEERLELEEGDGFLFLNMKCSKKKMVVRDLYHLPQVMAFASSLCKFRFFLWRFIILISCQARMHGFAMLHVGLQTCGGCFWTDWHYSSNKSQQGACFSAKDELRERAHQAEVGLAASVSSLFSGILSIDLTVYHLWSRTKKLESTLAQKNRGTGTEGMFKFSKWFITAIYQVQRTLDWGSDNTGFDETLMV